MPITQSIQGIPPRPRVVIYVCTTSWGDPADAQTACATYAHRCGWDVVATLHDRTGMTDPNNGAHRPGLAQALDLIRAKEADVLLVPAERAISLLGHEVRQFAQRVTNAGGNLRTATPAGAGAAR
jgi:DNA invertase Pin-like site-specific DNA recombinase